MCTLQGGRCHHSAQGDKPDRGHRVPGCCSNHTCQSQSRRSTPLALLSSSGGRVILLILHRGVPYDVFCELSGCYSTGGNHRDMSVNYLWMHGRWRVDICFCLCKICWWHENSSVAAYYVQTRSSQGLIRELILRVHQCTASDCSDVNSCILSCFMWRGHSVHFGECHNVIIVLLCSQESSAGHL